VRTRRPRPQHRQNHHPGSGPDPLTQPSPEQHRRCATPEPALRTFSGRSS
jgi:hypothetical protein